MKKRVRSRPKARTKSSKSLTSIRLFGPPLLLEGEDAVAYDELQAGVYAAVKPVDVIDEVLAHDFVASEWEVLRFRRLKSTLIRASAMKTLKDSLTDKLPINLYTDYFADDLTEVLQELLPKNRAEEARPLAEAFICNEPGTMEKVKEILEQDDRDWTVVEADARDRKVEELVQAYTRGEPDAVTLINILFEDSALNVDTFMANALADKLDYVERIDRLIALTSSRRNASLREIERRSAIRGEALRRSVQQIEDAEFKVIETMPAKGKDAA
jgi:hypothetical protein